MSICILNLYICKLNMFNRLVFLMQMNEGRNIKSTSQLIMHVPGVHSVLRK